MTPACRIHQLKGTQTAVKEAGWASNSQRGLEQPLPFMALLFPSVGRGARLPAGAPYSVLVQLTL